MDRFDQVCRIYEGKLKELHRLLDKKQIFGPISGFGESREFQKRGLPHAHRVFHSTLLAIPENIENVIWAHIPAQPSANDKSPRAAFIRKIRELLPKFQFHDCDQRCINPQTGRCTRGFPKPFSDVTILYPDRHAVYKRPSPENGGETFEVKRRGFTTIYDNSRIVPYNPFLLVYFQCHHNIEYAFGEDTGYR